MRQPIAPLSTTIEARQTATRRSLCYRPECTPLEDRQLLSVTLSGNGPSVPFAGSPVVWTATASGHGASPVYQFSVTLTGGPAQVVRDFSPNDNFIWNPLQQGNYEIDVTVKDNFSAATGETATATYTADSRASGPGALISATANPLVALYSVPPSSGSSVYVQYKLFGTNQPWRSTAAVPVVAGQSANILVANMLPNRVYVMRHVLSDGTTSAPMKFKTGRLTAKLKFPTFVLQKAPNARTDVSQSTVVHFGTDAPVGTVDTLATDRAGHVTWFYNPVSNGFTSYAASIVPGGTVLLLGGKVGMTGAADTLREVDLAGDTLRETNVDAISAELTAMGQHSITAFSHDAQRLPNGDTAILATTPRLVNLNGTPTSYNGDMVIVLDQNFHVAWVWDPFQFLDTNRLPTLGEGAGDWMHANSIAWSPEDGDLLVSMRNQDMVVKIDYANGAGDGHVVWRLGQGGDFTINSSDPSPWFSHQHDVRYVNDNTITLFDDGNTRRSTNPKAHSRGQELVLNEQTMTATLVVNADLGNYASAVGSAQLLPNGNLDFDSGFAEQTIEVLPNGTRNYVLKMNMSGYQYRSYIYSNLYGV